MNAPLTDNQRLREGTDYPSPITRVVALGYCDGPTEGVLQVGPSGEVYHFSLVEEFPREGTDETDLRMFELAPLPGDSLQGLAEALAPYAAPRWPLWAPVWRFPAPEIRQDVERRVDELLQRAGPVAWQITTDDLFGTLRSVKRPTPCPPPRTDGTHE